MRLMVACEFSAIVRDAFQARGYEAWSCDLLPTEGDPAWHIQDDIRTVLRTRRDQRRYRMLIGHPECTYVCGSGLHWNSRRNPDGSLVYPDRVQKTDAAVAFFRWMLGLDIPAKALENPIGCLSTRVRKPDQIIQPNWFGHDASKATCLWLEQLPKLTPTDRIPGRLVTDPRTGRQVERWANQTDSGQNRLGPSPDRWALRSATYPGIAAAMADQWGPYLSTLFTP